MQMVLVDMGTKQTKTRERRKAAAGFYFGDPPWLVISGQRSAIPLHVTQDVVLMIGKIA